MAVMHSLDSLSSALRVLVLTFAGLIHKGNGRLRLQRRLVGRINKVVGLKYFHLRN